ncbi:MAG: hypothetical protein IPI58_05725 [Alphaproteobacteria bacterium]|nr:MAG: hypothetical protein IPI58_05725 [Alphaproteobacteria bacterium]
MHTSDPIDDLALHLGAAVDLPGIPRSTVVGVDSYRLQNFADQILEWKSFTLTSDANGDFARWWITDLAPDGLRAWIDLGARPIPPDTSLVEERSGIATIAFEGNSGPSTPSAALVVLQGKDGQFYGLEKFSDGVTMRFWSCALGLLPTCAGSQKP